MWLEAEVCMGPETSQGVLGIVKHLVYSRPTLGTNLNTDTNSLSPFGICYTQNFIITIEQLV